MNKKLLILLIIVAIYSIVIGFKFLLFTDEKPKVVVVLPELNSEYWEIIKAGAEKGFLDFGIDGKVIAPSGNDIQELLLEKVLKESPDILVVCLIKSPKVISILEEFVKKDIPVLLLNQDVQLENKTTYIGTNNFELGRIAGELLASELQPGDKVAIITRDLTIPVFGERIKGAKSSLEAAGIKIVAQKEELPNEPLQVGKTMTMILQNHADIKGVLTTTDELALSVVEVIEEQGYKMPVIGSDGITKMLELIEDGSLSATVAQNPYDMGYLSAQTSMKVSKGEIVDKNIDTGVDIIIKGNVKERLVFLKKLL